jgi:hypothetical protein
MDSVGSIPLSEFQNIGGDAIPPNTVSFGNSPQFAGQFGPESLFAKPTPSTFRELPWSTNDSGTRFVRPRGYPLPPYALDCLLRRLVRSART